jgi:Fe-S-cluster containining protein
MKILGPDENAAGRRPPIDPAQRFRFRCHPGIGCFNRCCRNLNLFLYPYDVLRLKQALGISAEVFLDRYVDVILREGNHFPDVLLRMAPDAEQTCPFLSTDGCRVYPDRPDTCRTFPVEHGLLFGEPGAPPLPVSFFRPPEFCQGQHESTEWTLQTWADDQEARRHNRFTRQWAEIRALFHRDPWQGRGPDSPPGKMAFMATYNLDAFRTFVLQSSFLKRYRLAHEVRRRIEKDDDVLLELGFDWVKLFVWRIPSKRLRPR